MAYAKVLGKRHLVLVEPLEPLVKIYEWHGFTFKTEKITQNVIVQKRSLMTTDFSPLTEEEAELFSSYDSLMQIAKKPFDKADEQFLSHSLEGKALQENEDKAFEGELPPSLFEVERRLTGKRDDKSCLPIYALRQARHLSQEQLASRLHIEPKQISQLEQNTDKVLRILRHYIEAMGGQLDIIAHFPDGEVRINQIKSYPKRFK